MTLGRSVDSPLCGAIVELFTAHEHDDDALSVLQCVVHATASPTTAETTAAKLTGHRLHVLMVRPQTPIQLAISDVLCMGELAAPCSGFRAGDLPS
jgi:hypothetical protein